MDATFGPMETLTLKEIKSCLNCIGDLLENILNPHSLALAISASGEATFTSSGCKLLSEASFSHPLTKFIVNAAINYTVSCGDDCKYFVFILREIFNVMHQEVDVSSEIIKGKKLINEIELLKQILPCIFSSVLGIPDVGRIEKSTDFFFKDLYSVVFTFMVSRFSVCDSKILSNVICNFIQSIILEFSSLKIIIDYVISHFDIFFCKVISPLSESRIINGFILNTKAIPPNLNIESSKFLIILDLTMKLKTEDVAWKISDESFTSQLNSMHIYDNIFEHFKAQNISLILTPSVCENSLKGLSKKHNIFLIDRLEKGEIDHMLSCLHLYPLEDLNESLESKNIGELNFAKSLSINSSNFLHLFCSNSFRFLKANHVLLSAQCNTMWKEYYSECLNCFKMIYHWLKTDISICAKKQASSLLVTDSKQCNVCSEIKIYNFTKLEISPSSNFLLPPGAWEFVLKDCIKQVPVNSEHSCSTVLKALHFAIEKSFYKRIGVSLCHVKDGDKVSKDFFARSKCGDVNLLEPVSCKEIMIYNILDLLSQLLRIESIIFQNAFHI